jgi:hypothetical protein
MIFQHDSVSWGSRVTVIAPGGEGAGASDRQRFFIECRICGFEPDSQQGLPGHACPKCFSNVWHRVARPGAMVEREPGVTSTARLRRLSMVRRG